MDFLIGALLAIVPFLIGAKLMDRKHKLQIECIATEIECIATEKTLYTIHNMCFYELLDGVIEGCYDGNGNPMRDFKCHKLSEMCKMFFEMRDRIEKLEGKL